MNGFQDCSDRKRLSNPYWRKLSHKWRLKLPNLFFFLFCLSLHLKAVLTKFIIWQLSDIIFCGYDIQPEKITNFAILRLSDAFWQLPFGQQFYFAAIMKSKNLTIWLVTVKNIFLLYYLQNLSKKCMFLQFHRYQKIIEVTILQLSDVFWQLTFWHSNDH